MNKQISIELKTRFDNMSGLNDTLVQSLTATIDTLRQKLDECYAGIVEYNQKLSDICSDVSTKYDKEYREYDYFVDYCLEQCYNYGLIDKMEELQYARNAVFTFSSYSVTLEKQIATINEVLRQYE